MFLSYSQSRLLDSGHYWIQCSGLGSLAQVYCDMEYVQGGWMKVANNLFLKAKS